MKPVFRMKNDTVLEVLETTSCIWFESHINHDDGISHHLLGPDKCLEVLRKDQLVLGDGWVLYKIDISPRIRLLLACRPFKIFQLSF